MSERASKATLKLATDSMRDTYPQIHTLIRKLSAYARDSERISDVPGVVDRWEGRLCWMLFNQLSRETRPEELTVKDLPCTVCGARPGEACIVEDDEVVYHARRVADMHKAGDRMASRLKEAAHATN